MNNQSESNLAVRAQACLDSGNVVQASALFKDLCDCEPDNADAWLMNGALLGEAGSVKEAITCLEKAICLNPAYPEAQLTMAHLKQADNKIEEAYEYAKRAVGLDTSYDEAWVFLGAVCVELSYFEEAERACEEAINRWPENVNVYINRATALCHLERYGEAELVIRQAISLSGGHLSSADALLGRILIGIGKYSEAKIAIESALCVMPDDITLLVNLANIKLGQQKYKDAETLFCDITNKTPESADAWIGLGSVYQALYNIKEAEVCFQKAKNIAPTSSPAAHNLALLKQSKGEFNSAIDLLEDALLQHPGQLELIGCLASNYEQKGEYDRAIEVMAHALEQPEKSVQIAKVFQKLCVKLGQCTEAESYLKATLETSIVNPEEKAMLHFCLGELYDKQANYDLAFEQFECANEYKTESYEHSLYSQYIDQVISTYTPSAMASFPVSRQLSNKPIFIIGMPRSGTSLVERILSSHSMVYGAGELRNVIELTEKFPDFVKGPDKTPLNYPAGVKYLTQDSVDIMAEKYIDFIEEMSSDGVRVTDKMPHNFQYIGLIKQLFPNAKIIHCVRDAKDTCLSCYFQNFFGYHPYSNNLDDLARHHLDYQRLMQHWEMLDIPMLEVKYEDLVEDQTLWSKKLISYCDLDWEEDCIRFYEKGEQTRTASYDQVRQPIYTKSIARWKNYEKHLAPMLDILAVSE